MRPERFRVATFEEVAHYGGNLPKGLRAPMAGAAGPALDHNLGATGAAGSPIHINSAFTVAAGDVIIGCIRAAAGETYTFSDAKANTWSQVAPVTNAAGIGAAYVTTPLALNDAITASYGIASSTLFSVSSFTGLVSASIAAAYGYQQTNNGTTSTPSGSTAVSVKAGDLVVAWVRSTNTAGATIAQPSGWGALASSNTSGFGMIGGGWFVPSASGVVTYSPTLDQSCIGVFILIVAFPVSGTTSHTFSLTQGQSPARTSQPSRSFSATQGQSPKTPSLAQARSFAVTQAAGVTRSVSAARAFSATQAAAATTTRTPARMFKATQAASVKLTSAITRTLAAMQASTARVAASAARLFTRTQAATVSLSGAASRSVRVGQAAAVSVGGSRTTTRALTQTQGIALVRAVGGKFTVTQAAAGATAHGVARTVRATQTAAVEVRASASRSVSATQSASASLARALARALALSQGQDASLSAPALTRHFTVTQAQLVTSADAISRSFGSAQASAPTLAGEVARSVTVTQPASADLSMLAARSVSVTQAQSASVVSAAPAAGVFSAAGGQLASIAATISTVRRLTAGQALARIVQLARRFALAQTALARRQVAKATVLELSEGQVASVTARRVALGTFEAACGQALTRHVQLARTLRLTAPSSVRLTRGMSTTRALSAGQIVLFGTSQALVVELEAGQALALSPALHRQLRVLAGQSPSLARALTRSLTIRQGQIVRLALPPVPGSEAQASAWPTMLVFARDQPGVVSVTADYAKAVAYVADELADRALAADAPETLVD